MEDLRFRPDLKQMVANVIQERKELEAKRQAVHRQLRLTVRRLRANGLSVRDAAHVLGISTPYVQILGTDPDLPSRSFMTAGAATRRSACSHPSSSRLGVAQSTQRDSDNSTPRNPVRPRASTKLRTIQYLRFGSCQKPKWGSVDGRKSRPSVLIIARGIRRLGLEGVLMGAADDCRHPLSLFLGLPRCDSRHRLLVCQRRMDLPGLDRRLAYWDRCAAAGVAWEGPGATALSGQFVMGLLLTLVAVVPLWSRANLPEIRHAFHTIPAAFVLPPLTLVALVNAITFLIAVRAQPSSWRPAMNPRTVIVTESMLALAVALGCAAVVIDALAADPVSLMDNLRWGGLIVVAVALVQLAVSARLALGGVTLRGSVGSG